MNLLALHRLSRRSAPWTRRGGGALLVSAFVHVALAATIGGVVGSAQRSSAPEPDAANVEVALVLNASALAPDPQAAPATVAPLARARTAARPRLAALPHQPVAVLSSGAPLPSPSETADDDALPVRFALSAGTVATGPALAAAPGSAAKVATGASVAGPLGEAQVDEAQVDVRAQLIAAGPLVYPPAARQAEIEADLPLEIVVDATGRVVAARSVSRAGHGLDEAALRAIRDYRFSPARRAGRPVPVRMRWNVQFRLR